MTGYVPAEGHTGWDDQQLDSVPLDALLAAVARRKERAPYESEADLLAAEASGWVAVAILQGKGRGQHRPFASVFGPYGKRSVAAEARAVIQRNHALAQRKGKTQTTLLAVEVKPIWKEPT